MKKLKIYTVATVLTGICLSSCQKKYDPSSYAPALNIGGYSSASAVAKENLVSLWSFNGSLVDSVSNTAGTNTGTTFTGGIKGQALQGALNSYVLAAPNAKITSLKSFTITEWVNTPPPSTGVIGFFSLANTSEFWGNIDMFFENGSTNANGKVRIHVNPGKGDQTLALDNVQNLFDKWVNIAVTYNGADSTCTLFVGGSQIGSSKFANGGPITFANTGNLVFGCVQFMTDPSQTSATTKQDWASYLTGAIDEVRIYDKVLSAAEIGAIVKLEGRGK